MPAAKKKAARKKTPKKKAARKAAAPDTLAGISSEAVENGTGESWAHWLRVLDRLGAEKMAHKEIAVILHDGHGLSGWWAQMVTVGYEQARGLRVPGQKADGFSANASRTIAAPVERAFTMIANSTGRRQWIGVPESTFEVTKATPTKSVRIAWKGDTRVEINLYAKGANKCMVQVQHNKLPDAEQAERAKKFWGAALDMLRGKLEL